MYRSLEAGPPRDARSRRHLRRRRRRARGRAATRSRSRSATVDEVVRVTNDEICAAIKDVFDDTRSIMEPAGALAVAGLKTWVGAQSRGDRARGRRAERRQHELRPAALRRRAGRAGRGPRGDLRRDDPRAAGRLPRVLRRARPPRRHRVQLPARRPRRGPHLRRRRAWPRGRTRGRSPGELARGRLRDASTCPTTRLAKLHVRHMVGGRASDAQHERLCRFEFPERPGALMQFLETLGGRWNISLFHYRNHGADFGRVLAALRGPRRGAWRVQGVPGRARLSVSGRVRQRRVPVVSRMRHPPAQPQRREAATPRTRCHRPSPPPSRLCGIASSRL